MSSTHLPKRPVLVVDGEVGQSRTELKDPLLLGSLYTYEQLPCGDYFRLLVLLPGERGQTLRCSIGHYNLDAWNMPPYKALSYTWGESQYDDLVIAGERVPMDSNLRRQYDIRHPLDCGDGRLLISTNLRDALRSIRHPLLPVMLWVDAVCINQMDDAERSAQIMLMPRIYHRASLVLLWIGEADEDTQPAFEMIQRLASVMQSVSGEGPAGPAGLQTAALAAGIRPPNTGPGVYGPFLRLLNRPVFRRIWCVQEAAVGGSVIVRSGRKTPGVPELSYASLAQACAFLRKVGWSDKLEQNPIDGKDTMFFPTAVLGTRADWFMRRIDRSLLVFEMRSFEASDPRDKVFALLGILGDHSHRRLNALGGPSESSECSEGHHKIDCPHMRERIQEFAETKWEQRGGLYPLWYAANQRIYNLVGLLSRFFETAKALLEDIRDSCADSHDPGIHATIRERRVDADHQYIRIRGFLDGICDKFVSSDELVSYRWASNKIERCVSIYDEVFSQHDLGAYASADMTFPSPLLEEVAALLRMMRREDEYASSPVLGASSPGDSSEYSALDRAIRADLDESMAEEPPDKTGHVPEVEGIPTAAESVKNTDTSRETAQIAKEVSLPLIGSRDDSHTSSRREGFSNDEEDAANSDNDGDDEKADPGESLSSSDIDDGYENDGSDAWMAVGEDEVPAELSLALYFPSFGEASTAPGLDYMAARETPERPVITAEPIEPWSVTLSLLPDYSMPTAEVYLTYTLQCLHKTQRLDLLSWVDAFQGSNRIKGLPSWVPDFGVSLTDRIDPLVQPLAYRRDIWDCAAGTECSIAWDPSAPRVLILQGALVDRIAGVSNLRTDVLTLDLLKDEWRMMTDSKIGVSAEAPSIHAIENPSGIPYKEDESKTSTVVNSGDSTALNRSAESETQASRSWNNLLFSLIYPANAANGEGYTLFTDPDEAYAAFLAFLCVQQSGVNRFSDLEKLLDESGIRFITHIPEKIPDLICAMRLLALGRRIVYTERGRVVFAPETTEAGDGIYIVKGGKVPFVLRGNRVSEVEGGAAKQDLQLVGECLCEGIMTGQLGEEIGNAWTSISLV
ncbi:HET-domain-containing protein [Thozetella sp. PMI_491]|nr:HET-domain-containing protein [Thozetella sp. PMI_491]